MLVAYGGSLGKFLETRAEAACHVLCLPHLTCLPFYTRVVSLKLALTDGLTIGQTVGSLLIWSNMSAN